MKFSIQGSYWSDRLESRTGGAVQQVKGLEKKFGRAFHLANSNFCMFSLASTLTAVCSVWPILIFGLFGRDNTHNSVCSTGPILLFQSVRSGQYPHFVLANIHILINSVWPTPRFRSVRSGQCQTFGLVNTHISRKSCIRLQFCIFNQLEIDQFWHNFSNHFLYAN